MKRLTCILLLFTLIFGLQTVAFASSGDEFAVYVNSSINAYSTMRIEGDIYLANGDVTISNIPSNEILGDIYINKNNKYSESLNGTVTFTGNINTHIDGKPVEQLKELRGAPAIDNYVSEITAGYWPLAPDITSDAHIGTLKITNYIRVDTTKGDITLVVDKLTLENQGHIDVIGSGKLNLYVLDDLNIGGSCSINNGKRSDCVNLIVNKNFSLGGNASVYANVYSYGEQVDIKNSATLFGNVILPKANEFSIIGAVTVNGIVYAPYAAANVSGSATINGRLAANSLDISKDGKIIYNSLYQRLEIPSELFKEELPTDKPTKMPKNSGAYIFGRTDTKMVAHDELKRGEAASMIYRLLKQNDMLSGFEYNKYSQPAFYDINGRWDRSALEYMTYIEMYDANPSGLIKPLEGISRGEVFKMFCLALELSEDKSLTNEQYAEILKKEGYIEGYGNGDLMLEDTITRAQMCAMYNRIIGRENAMLVTADGMEITPETYGFIDIQKDWAYETVLIATSAYDADGYVDLEARSLRNVLDDYN